MFPMLMSIEFILEVLLFQRLNQQEREMRGTRKKPQNKDPDREADEAYIRIRYETRENKLSIFQKICLKKQ